MGFANVNIGGPVQTSGSAKVSGTRTFKVRWIGLGPSPQFVILELASVAYWGRDGQSGELELGLPFSTGSASNQTGLAYKKINLSNGEGTVTIKGSSKVNLTHIPRQDHVSSGGEARWDAHAVFAPQAIGIVPSPNDTYRQEYDLQVNPLRVLNLFDLIDDRTIDIGVSPELDDNDSIIQGRYDLPVNTWLVGEWGMPVTYTWEAPGSILLNQYPGSNVSNDIARLIFSSAEINLMASGANSGGSRLVKVTAQEGPYLPNGTTRLTVHPPKMAKLTIRPHALSEYVGSTTGANMEDTNEEYRPGNISVRVPLNAGGTHQFSISSGTETTSLPSIVALGVQTEARMNAGGILGRAFKKVAEIAFAASGQISTPLGSQETTSSQFQSTYTYGPAVVDGEIWTLYKVKTWVETRVTANLFSSNGFDLQETSRFVKKGSLQLNLRARKLSGSQ